MTLIIGNTVAAGLPAPAVTQTQNLSQQAQEIVGSQLPAYALPTPLPQRWDNQALGKYFPGALNHNGLPLPRQTPQLTKILSLQEAILLALRNSPIVMNAQMQRVMDKYSLEGARRALRPQLNAIGASLNINTGQKPSYTGLSDFPTVTLSTGFNTQITLGYAPNLAENFHGSGYLRVEQPLLKGFNTKYLEYIAAVDGELSARIGYQTAIEGVISSVITDYLAAVSSVMDYKIQQNSMQQQKEQLRKSKLMLQVGQSSPSDYRQQEASYAQALFNFEKQKLAVKDAYRTLITTLALSPATAIKLPASLNVKTLPVDLPSFAGALKRALAQNSVYQTAVLAMRSTQLAIRAARDELRWNLDMVYTHNFNGGASSSSGLVPATPAAPLTHSRNGNSLGSTYGQAGSTPLNNDALSFNLTIPINNFSNQKSLVQARISYEEAKIALRQSRDEVITNITQDYQSIVSDKEQIKLAQQSVALSQHVLRDSQLRLRWGKIPLSEFIQNRDSVLTTEKSLVDTQEGYFNDVEKLHQDMGDVLNVWHIKLRY